MQFADGKKVAPRWRPVPPDSGLLESAQWRALSRTSQPLEIAVYEHAYPTVALNTARYRPTMSIETWRWVQANCRDRVRPTLRIDIDRHYPSQRPDGNLLCCTLTPVMRFWSDDVAMFRMLHC